MGSRDPTIWMGRRGQDVSLGLIVPATEATEILQEMTSDLDIGRGNVSQCVLSLRK